ATMLERTNRHAEALQQIEQLLASDPASRHYRILKAAALVGIGEYQQALELFETLLEERRDNAGVWVTYGNVLRTLGRPDEAVSAYRKSAELEPGLGEP